MSAPTSSEQPGRCPQPRCQTPSVFAGSKGQPFPIVCPPHPPGKRGTHSASSSRLRYTSSSFSAVSSEGKGLQRRWVTVLVVSLAVPAEPRASPELLTEHNIPCRHICPPRGIRSQGDPHPGKPPCCSFCSPRLKHPHPELCCQQESPPGRRSPYKSGASSYQHVEKMLKPHQG